MLLVLHPSIFHRQDHHFLSRMHHLSSRFNSCHKSLAQSESDSEPLNIKEHQLNPKHMKCLQRNKIQFDHDLCQNIDKPMLQFLYQRYCATNNIYCQVDQMAKGQTQERERGGTKGKKKSQEEINNWVSSILM